MITDIVVKKMSSARFLVYALGCEILLMPACSFSNTFSIVSLQVFFLSSETLFQGQIFVRADVELAASRGAARMPVRMSAGSHRLGLIAWL